MRDESRVNDMAEAMRLAGVDGKIDLLINPASLLPILNGIEDSRSDIADRLIALQLPPPEQIQPMLDTLKTQIVNAIPAPVSLVQVNAKLDALIAALVPVPPPPANLLPTIGLTSSVLVATEPGSILLSATPADSDGTITKVEYYDNGIFIGQRVQAPFAFTYPNVTAGPHSLTAKAFDNATPPGVATSAASIQTIDPAVIVPPTIEQPIPIVTI